MSQGFTLSKRQQKRYAKKRIRKKLHLAEFAEFGSDITLKLKAGSEDSFNAVFDRWLDILVEKQWCFNGGGAFHGETGDTAHAVLNGLLTGIKAPGISTEDVAWLRSEFAKWPEVESAEVGEPMDVWYL